MKMGCLCSCAGDTCDYMFLLFSLQLMRPGRPRWISLGGSNTYSVKSWWAHLTVVGLYLQTYCFLKPCKSCESFLFCIHSWAKRWRGNSTPTSMLNMNGACSMKTWMKVMKIWMRRWDTLLYAEEEFISCCTARWDNEWLLEDEET